MTSFFVPRLGTRIALLLVAVGALLFLASCSLRSSLHGTRYLIGVSQANLSEPWRVAMNAEIKASARSFPDLTAVCTDAADSSERQIADVRHLMEYGVDLLIISPTDAKALTPIIRDLYQYIPVIVLDRDIEGYDYTLFIGPDNERLGREAGLVARRLLGKGGGRVLEIQGRPLSPPTVSRSHGFSEGLAGSGNIALESPLVADWLRDRAEDEFFRRFGGHDRAGAGMPGVPDVVFAHNDAMAWGASRAASRLGLQKKIRFIGIDGLSGPSGGVELVRQGILSATFTCPTGGREAVGYAMDILTKAEGIPKKVLLRPREVLPGIIPSDPLSRSPVAREPGRPIRLGFAQVGAESSWRVANTQSIKAAAVKAGVELHFVDGEQSQEKQIAAIKAFIRDRMDLIAFSPVVETGWDAVLAEAKAAGIPVILTDRGVSLEDDSLWLSFMGSDFEEEGRRAARWLLEELGEESSVPIVELRGTEGSAPAINRKKGFEAVIAEHPSFTVIRSEAGDFTRASGEKLMKGILASGTKDFRVLFAHNDDMALGAIPVLEAAGLRPGRDVIVISIDAVRSAFDAMRSGKLNCTVECNPLLGPLLMKAVKDYMAGKDLPRRLITSEEVFPREAADRELRTRRY